MNKPGRRSKIAVGSQSRRATRLSRNRESESLGENARCGVTVTRVSVSEPSRREKEPERGSFGAKQRIKKEEERKGKRNQSKCLERIRSSHRAQPGHTMTERSFSSFSLLCCREYCSLLSPAWDSGKLAVSKRQICNERSRWWRIRLELIGKWDCFSSGDKNTR